MSSQVNTQVKGKRQTFLNPNELYEPFLKNEVTVIQPAKKDSKNEDPGLQKPCQRSTVEVSIYFISRTNTKELAVTIAQQIACIKTSVEQKT